MPTRHAQAECNALPRGVGDGPEQERTHRQIGQGDEDRGSAVTSGPPRADQVLTSHGGHHAGGAEADGRRSDADHQHAMGHTEIYAAGRANAAPTWSAKATALMRRSLETPTPGVGISTNRPTVRPAATTGSSTPSRGSSNSPLA